MDNFTLAHFVLFPSISIFLLFSLCVPPFPSLVPILLILSGSFSVWCIFFFLQTVLGVELRSSRVNLSWRWRNSGTSAASDVEPATWSSPESISASECEKENKKKHLKPYNSHDSLRKDTQTENMSCCVYFWWNKLHFFHIQFLFRLAKLCIWYNTVASFICSVLQGWSAILWGRLPRSVRGEMWDLQQIHQWKGSGGENRTAWNQNQNVLQYAAYT